MGPFEVLGVARNADEATIKRAYAKALKANRPEDDAVAFQAINEAYQAALDVARHRQARQQASDVGDEVAVMDRPQPVPTPMPRVERIQPAPAMQPAPGHQEAASAPMADEAPFEYVEFVQQLWALCDKDNPRKLDQWLKSLPALYHIDRKAAVGDALLRQWLQAATSQPLLVGHADVLSRFFDRDFHHVVALAEQARTREEIEDDIARERMHRLGETESGAKVLRQLKRRPFRRWRALLATIDAPFAARAAMLSRRLAQRNGGSLPASINPEQVEFMELLANPYYEGRWRWISLLLRSAVIAGGIGGAILLLLAGLFYKAGVDMPEGLPTTIGGLTAMFLGSIWVREGLGWLRLREDDKSNRAGRIARWLPVGLAAVAVLLALPGLLPAYIPYLLLGLAIAGAVRNRNTFCECLAMAVGFGMLLAPRMGAEFSPSLMFLIVIALAVITRRCAELAISRSRKVPVSRAGDNWTTRAIAAAVFIVAVALLPPGA